MLPIHSSLRFWNVFAFRFSFEWVCSVLLYICWGDFSFQTECENLGLETFYRTYVQRLQRSSLSMFFVMHTVIAMVHTITLVATQVCIRMHLFDIAALCFFGRLKYRRIYMKCGSLLSTLWIFFKAWQINWFSTCLCLPFN